MFVTKRVLISDLELAWTDVIDSKENNTVFQSFEWNSNWMASFRPSQEQVVLAVFDNHDLVAIIPVYSRKILLFWFYHFIADNVSDYADLVIIRHSEPLMNYLMEFLVKQFTGINKFFFFRNIALDSWAFKLWSSNCASVPFSQTVISKNEEFYLKNNCKKKQVKNNDRLIKRLEEKGNLKFEMFDSSHENLSGLIENKKISLAIKNQSSILFNPSFKEMFKKLIDNKNGHWFISTLKLNGQVIASSINAIHGTRFYYYMPSFDNEFYKFSPSSLLLQFLLNELGSMDHIKTIDFLKGDESYKSIWAIDHCREELVMMSNAGVSSLKFLNRIRHSKLISKLKSV
jgi:CelD/BcsL family acetyltransferase involved in cellulose biosynthesis